MRTSDFSELTRLGIAPASVLAFDVGGTTVKAALVSGDGVVLDTRILPSPQRSPGSAEALLDALTLYTDELRARNTEDIAAVGLGVPGLVDEQTGIAIFSANLGWRDVPLAELATRRIGIPVVLGHDVRSAAEAEVRLGAARGIADVAVVAIGTGLSAVSYADGRIVRSSGFAGEIGHLRVAGSDQACACGGIGCVESIGSARAIAKRYSERSGVEVTSAGTVAELVGRGDQLAEEVWSDAIDAISCALTALASVTAPEVIVIGGGLALAGDVLLGPLRQNLRERLTVQREPRLVAATFGTAAGLAGSVLRARDVISQ
jgi:glucokinase